MEDGERKRLCGQAYRARKALACKTITQERRTECLAIIAEWERVKKKPKATSTIQTLAERRCVPSIQNCLNCKLPNCIGDSYPARRGELVHIPQGSTSSYYRLGHSSYDHII